MPEIQHEKIRGKHVIGSFEAEFDAEGVATVPSETFDAVKGLKGYTQLGQMTVGERKKIASPAVEAPASRKKIILKKKA